MIRDKQKTVDTAVRGRLSTRNRSENGSSTQGYEDFNTRRYPEVKGKDLREMLCSNSETTGGMTADLVLKV